MTWSKYSLVQCSLLVVSCTLYWKITVIERLSNKVLFRFFTLIKRKNRPFGLFHSSALKECTQVSVDGIHGYLKGVVQPVISNSAGDRSVECLKHQKHNRRTIFANKSSLVYFICFLYVVFYE